MPGADGTNENQNQPQTGSEGGEGKQTPNEPAPKEGEGNKGNSGPVDLATLDPQVQKLIKDLRNENAQHRNQNKNLGSQLGALKGALVSAGLMEDDSEKPEEKIKGLTERSAHLEFRSAILESALEHGIGKDGLEYFEFLVSKSVNELEEGQELTEEMLGELAGRVKKQTAAPANGTSTSVTTGNANGGGNPPPPGDTGGVTLDQFVKMNITEKSMVYQKTPELYNRLIKEAKEKKLLI